MAGKGHNSGGVCRVCERTLESYRDCTKMRVCHRCYQGMKYWSGRSVKDLVARADQLEALSKRMAFMIGGESKVVPFPQRKKRVSRASARAKGTPRHHRK